MPNGKPGDHPVTDVLVHGREAISPRTTELIRSLSVIGGRDALRRFELDLLALDGDVVQGIADPFAIAAMESRLAAELERLRADAIARGWEVDETG